VVGCQQAIGVADARRVVGEQQVLMLPWDRRQYSSPATWVFSAFVDTTGRNLARVASAHAYQLPHRLEGVTTGLAALRGMRVQEVPFPSWDKRLLLGAAIITYHEPRQAMLYSKRRGPGQPVVKL
jgi:hypothetical protein